MMKLTLLLLPLLLFAQQPKLLLLETYTDQNISGWVMSEKLDGIRAYWDGKRLISRGGHIIHAPAWFTQHYPPFALDGELWSARQDFETIASIVRDRVPSEAWHSITHCIFDVPHAQGDLLQRLAHAAPYEHRYLRIIPQLPVANTKHLQSFLKEVESQGGEGVVVRNPHIGYMAHRTHQALKVKTFHDAECVVIAHHQGRGKYRHLLGAFTCKLDHNITFKIGSGLSDEERRHPPEIGTTVTFRHQGFTRYKKPRFPVFLRVKRAF